MQEISTMVDTGDLPTKWNLPQPKLSCRFINIPEIPEKVDSTKEYHPKNPKMPVNMSISRPNDAKWLRAGSQTLEVSGMCFGSCRFTSTHFGSNARLHLLCHAFRHDLDCRMAFKSQ